MMKRLFVGAAILAAAMMVLLGTSYAAGEADGGDDVIEEMVSRMTVEEKIGQMVMTHLRYWDEDPENEDSAQIPVTSLPDQLKEALSRDRFGGVILYAENCAENEQMIRLIDEIQKSNLETDSAVKIPLLIAADQEGGIVARLGQGTRWMGNMAMTATGDPDTAETVAEKIGEELSAAGINTDFAPVLDVNNNADNPVIGVRSFSDVPETVSEYGLKYLSGLKKTGTIAAVKHFPGHGDVATDSHTGFPVLEKTLEELNECELIPFRAAVDAGAEMVMTAHIQYPEIDNRTYTSITTGEEVFYPATLSSVILTDLLRGEMGFEGVIVSDALEMAAIKDNFALTDMSKMAVEAGVNLFLVPVTVSDADSLKALEEWMHSMCAMVESGDIDEEKVNDSVRRILKLKQAHGLLEEVPSHDEDEIAAAAGKIGSRENRDLEWELLKKSVTMLKNDEDLIPLKVEGGEKFLVAYTSESYYAAAEFARLRLVEEGLLPESVIFEPLVCSPDNREVCTQAAAEADAVIVVSVTSNVASLDPTQEGGAVSAVVDDVIRSAHDAGKKVILVSSRLPYDAARYQEADAIVLTYGSMPMKELPKGEKGCSVNIPAAICGIFGEYPFAGTLPVDIPKMENYHFTDEILYKRGE